MGRIQGPGALPVVGLAFLGLGLVGLLAAGGLALVELRSSRTAYADGVVIEAASRAKIQFKTDTGETIEFRNSVKTSATSDGDRLRVAYDPRDPRDASVDGFDGRWFLPDLFGLLAGSFLLMGGCLVLVGRRLTAGAA